MTVPTRAGPVAPRPESRVEPASQVPAAVPALYAATDIATPRVGAAPANRTASDDSTGFALSPTSPSTTTSTIVGPAWAETRQSEASTIVVTAGTAMVVACGRTSPRRPPMIVPAREPTPKPTSTSGTQPAAMPARSVSNGEM
jgi:hypothetical protein